MAAKKNEPPEPKRKRGGQPRDFSRNAGRGPGAPIRLPPEAFDFWVGLGPFRKYQAVADEYKVSYRAVQQRAHAEKWPQRLDKIEAKARAKMENRQVETIAQTNERHIKSLRAVQHRALEALKKFKIKNAMDAAKALHASVKLERLILGEPTDRAEVSVDQKIRQEYERWMVVKTSESEEPKALEGPEDPEAQVSV